MLEVKTMCKNNRSRALVLGFALGLLLASAASAARQETVLGSAGELYRVRVGAYGEFFSGVKPADRYNSVLALEVVTPGQPQTRVLVPTTQNTEVEASASLVFEEDTNTVFVLWESQSVNSILKLAGFDGTRWSTPIEITGNPWSRKTSPQLTVTRDSHEETVADGEPIVRHRTILHLLWEEEGQDDLYETFYTPVILEDGVYLGWNPVYKLSEFDPSQRQVGAASTGGDAPMDLIRAPMIQPGLDGRTVVVGFISTASRRLVTLEIDVLPEQLAHLADATRSTIIDTGFNPADSGVLPILVQKARATIFEVGTAFHPEILAAIAEQAEARIKGGGSDLVTLAGDTRSTIIDTGAKFSARGLRPIKSVSAIARLDEVHPSGPHPPADHATSGHLIQFRTVSDRTAPQAPLTPAPVRMFLSPSGQDVAVSWAFADRVSYRITRGNAWSELRDLKLSGTFTLEDAYDVLEQRVRNR